MDIQAVSGAATIAIGCAFVFLLVAKSWHVVSRTWARAPNFADSIMSEAAQRFRDELKQISRAKSSYLGATLVFIVIYGSAMAFQGPELFSDYPDWQLYLVLTVLVAAAMFIVYRLFRTFATWHEIQFLRDANIAVGHELQRVAAAQGRAYHDVATPNGYIDHVLVGPSGVYAINVVARRHLKKGAVCLKGNNLHFSNGGKTLSIVKIVAAAKRMQKEFCSIAGKNIRVRSVIAVPGWNIQDQTSNEYLLVNERTLPMISGWKDQNDFLMNEDVNVLQKVLTSRCKLTTA